MIEAQTLSELFAVARGKKPLRGAHRCFYCGAMCDESHSIGQWVKPTCTVRQYVMSPSSGFVCAGCAESMCEKSDAVVWGESSPRRGVRIRCFSWVITAAGATAFTKAHVCMLAAICIKPPAPPFGIVLSDSGQKHLIYRGRINRGNAEIEVGLEEEIIHYDPSELAAVLANASGLCAACGKPPLMREPSATMFSACMDAYGNTELAERWAAAWASPVNRLAAWLTPGREQCRKIVQ